MTDTILAATLIAICLIACKNLGADKPTAEILNVNELNALHKKDKEALRTKYDGKEVIVMGRAIEGFDPGAKRRSA